MAANNELKELFLAEALDIYEQLNGLLVALEKNPEDKPTIDAIFRLIHTLKGNAGSMNFEDLEQYAHSMEDVFGLVRESKLKLGADLVTTMFKALDLLGGLIEQLKNPDKVVRFKGMKRKLEVITREARNISPEEELKGIHPKQASESAEPQESQPSDRDHSQEEASPSNSETGETEKPIGHKVFNQDEEDLGEEEVETEAYTAISLSDRVSIPIYKLDKLLNLIGELLIERDRVSMHYKQVGLGRATEITRLNRITSDLQYSIMDARLIQVNVLFGKFNRIVRDLAIKGGKEVELLTEGGEIEIDRNVLQAISDSLIHLVRNAIDHGIEPADQREQEGKPRKGTIKLKAVNDKDQVVIQVQDNGKGIDHHIIRKKAKEKKLIQAEVIDKMSPKEILQFIFAPGFSSAEKVTEVSGRGVGMDVVKRSVESIGGSVEIMTEIGSGTIFNLRLPSTMAVKPVMLFTLNNITYAMPLSYLEAVSAMDPTEFHEVGKGHVVRFQGESLPVLPLSNFFFEEDFFSSIEPSSATKVYCLIVNYQDKKYALVVEAVTQQKEIVEKPLSPPLDGLRFISGTTILGDGSVSLVVDVPSIIATAFHTNYQSSFSLQS